MSAIQAQINRIKDFREDIDRIVIGLCQDRRDLIVQMNTEQLEGGLDGEGQEVRPPYRPSTIARKRRKGQPTDRVTLRDEGDFHESFDVRYSDDQFLLFATDEKQRYLIPKYGNDVFGLTPDNIDRLANDIKDEFVEAFKKAVQQ